MPAFSVALMCASVCLRTRNPSLSPPLAFIMPLPVYFVATERPVSYSPYFAGNTEFFFPFPEPCLFQLPILFSYYNEQLGASVVFSTIPVCLAENSYFSFSFFALAPWNHRGIRFHLFYFLTRFHVFPSENIFGLLAVLFFGFGFKDFLFIFGILTSLLV